MWAALAQLADMAGEAWRQTDQGIWEVRSGGRVFTYSAAMCQVALDRAAAIGERLDLPGPVPAWRAAAEKLRQTVLDQSWAKFGAPLVVVSLATVSVVTWALLNSG